MVAQSCHFFTARWMADVIMDFEKCNRHIHMIKFSITAMPWEHGSCLKALLVDISNKTF